MKESKQPKRSSPAAAIQTYVTKVQQGDRESPRLMACSFAGFCALFPFHLSNTNSDSLRPSAAWALGRLSTGARKIVDDAGNNKSTPMPVRTSSRALRQVRPSLWWTAMAMSTQISLRMWSLLFLHPKLMQEVVFHISLNPYSLSYIRFNFCLMICGHWKIEKNHNYFEPANVCLAPISLQFRNWRCSNTGFG